jgi:hypothetical protein
MTDSGKRLATLPDRPLDLDEIDHLEEADRFATILYDEGTIETTGDYALVYNCVLVLAERLAGAIYDEAGENWYRVYSESRPEAELTAAYDAIRDVRGDDSLFSRAPVTVEEAVFRVDRPSGDETCVHDPGDTFECPVCGQGHTVRFQPEDDYALEVDSVDTSHLAVECPESRRGQLILEFQAKTSRETLPPD